MKRRISSLGIENHYGDYYEPEMLEELIPSGEHIVRMDKPKPKVWQYSYSNQDSQGALICETCGFPSWYDSGTQECHSAYSDRIREWDRERFTRACALAGGGEQGWAYRLPSLNADELREFARVALSLPVLPVHVRVVHYYNVSSGYSCPVVIAIYPKQPSNEIGDAQ